MILEIPLHPSLVHFPIGILFLAGIFYLLSLFIPQEYLSKAGFLALIIGTVATVVAVLSGDQAEEMAKPTGIAHEMVEKHELLALICAWGFGLLTGWAFMRQKRFLQIEKIIFTVVIWAGIILLLITAHEGGEIVYEQGVGVN